jgi:hypothetical protein
MRISTAIFITAASLTLAIPSIASGEDADGDGVIDSSDNCVQHPNLDQADSDEDGSGDMCDNCTEIPNSGQQDSDEDGYGNSCDGDLNNDYVTGIPDFNIFRDCINMPGQGARDGCFIADFNSDHRVDNIDFQLIQEMFGSPPGPSGLAP